MPKTDRLILVVGVGRSGTSLTMQALDRLGAGLSQNLIPASETNRRGAFEDREVRDRLTALGHRFGHFNDKILPSDWQEDALARETQSWLETHLRQLAEQCGAPALAIKFPLSSIFLPIWYAAAAAVGLELRPVWATRRAEDVMASLVKAGRFGAEGARSRFLLRTHSLLKDLSADTLLLPYEGWREAPEEQIRALAEAAALNISDLPAALSDLFDPNLDHATYHASAAAEADDPMLRRIDETIAGRRGRASELFGPGLDPLRQLADEVVRALPNRDPESDETGKLRAQLSLRNTRIRDLDEKVSRYETEIAELRAACQSLARARDMEEIRRQNVVADYERAALEAQCDAKERLEREQQKAARNIARAEKAETRADRAEQECRACRREIEALHGSIRWRMGDAISQAVRRPRPRNLLRPARLLNLWFREKRGR